MAAGILPKPGTKLGPCKRCEHLDCKETRAFAESTCPYCHKPVGYGVRFYRQDEYFVHARCHEDACENHVEMF